MVSFTGVGLTGAAGVTAAMRSCLSRSNLRRRSSSDSCC